MHYHFLCGFRPFRCIEVAESVILGADSSDFSIVAMPHQGFWSSKGRPSEHGIRLDTQAALQWIVGKYDLSNTRVVIWGQSNGAGVAMTALAMLLENEKGSRKLAAICGMILETPFINLQSILVAFYPQRFLSYRYLYSFWRLTWDGQEALQRITAGNQTRLPKPLIIQVGSNEIVPAGHTEVLNRVFAEIGLNSGLIVINRALYTEIIARYKGRKAVAQFMKNMSKTERA